jgi:hypothetical protein
MSPTGLSTYDVRIDCRELGNELDVFKTLLGVPNCLEDRLFFVD